MSQEEFEHRKAQNVGIEYHRSGETAPIVRAVPPWALWASIASVAGLIGTGVGNIFSAGAQTEAIRLNGIETKAKLEIIEKKNDDLRILIERVTVRLESHGQRIDSLDQRISMLERGAKK